MKNNWFVFIVFFVAMGCQSASKDMRAYKDELRLHPYPVLQGVTTDTSTLITVVALNDESLSFRSLGGAELVQKSEHKSIKAGETGRTVHQLRFFDLKPDSHYTFQIIKNNKVIDQRTFSTTGLLKKEVKFGVVSCTSDKFLAEQFEMWSDYFNHNPDYTFLIGDNVYADYLFSKELGITDKAKAHEAMMWRRYVETWSSLLLYRTANLIPTLALWDDHDFGVNDGGKDFPFKDKTLEIFRTFFPLHFSTEVRPLAGAGFVFDGYGQRFMFIDARSFRSPQKVKNPEEQTQWGAKQTEMVMAELKKPKPSWLIQGDQFFGAYHRFESFEGHRSQDFKKTLTQIKSSPSKVIFVSGDRHLNEFMRIEKDILGYETYEMTSSAMHANVYPNSWQKRPNPRQMHGQSGMMNYSMVTSKLDSQWQVKVEAFGPKMQMLYDVDVKLDVKK